MNGDYIEEPQSAEPQRLEPWKLLGRDNPAGRALFNLYNGDLAGKGVGNKYSQRNKKVHEKNVAAGYTPPPLVKPKVKVEKTEVPVPKFVKKMEFSAEARLEARLPHRKPGQAILTEMKEEADKQWQQPMPVPKGPLLDEAEKERCAALMRYRGKVPEVSEEEMAAARRPRPKSERQELQDMFDSVLLEIEERRAFLAELEKHGALQQDKARMVQVEIKERVAEMQKIDRMIRELQLEEKGG